MIVARVPGWGTPWIEGALMNFTDIAWLPLCAGLTAVGVGLSYLAFRRRG